MQSEKIPVIVGVTGHRNIAESDKAEIKEKVKQSLQELKARCGEKTPLIMLNALAQGADILCAEAAFEEGVDVYAVLPCEYEKYKESFDDEIDKAKLEIYLKKVKKKFIASDMEKNRAWLKKTVAMTDEDYEYRQAGVYIAEHSHVLIALWDGNPADRYFGCGTVEVIKFALESNYLDSDRLFKPAMINGSSVIWIKSRRRDAEKTEITKKWLISRLAENGKEGERYADYIISDKPNEFFCNVIRQTVKYNEDSEKVKINEEDKLWTDANELDGYRKTLRRHFVVADELSYAENQTKYKLFTLLLAIFGTLVVCSFLVYDSASLPHMIIPCVIFLSAVIWICNWGFKRKYHSNYINYRAFAESLRIQFYMSMCLKEKDMINVYSLYSWTQKVETVWIGKAVRAIDVISDSDKKFSVDLNKVKEIWIGNNEKPKGQLNYHSGSIVDNLKSAKLFETLSKIFKYSTVIIYFFAFAIELVSLILKTQNINFFWEANIVAQFSWRNLLAIVLGSFTAGSLLFSSYWGKMSYGRKADDNIKMRKFYAAAYERWDEAIKHPNGEFAKFVKEIAREEIVENGIWCSYVNENRFDINL